MKILITSHTYYPKKDGVQSVTQYLAEGLVSLGYEVTVFTNYYENINMKYNEVHNGVNIRRFNVKTKFLMHFGEKKEYLNTIEHEIDTFDILINVCTQCPLTDWILPRLKNIKIGKILYLHSMFDFKYSKNDFKSLSRLIKKIISNLRWKYFYLINSKNFKEYDEVIQLHQFDYANEFFRKKYNIESKIIENAVEDIFFNNVYSLSNNNTSRYILNVSNYCDRKNQKLLLNVFLHSKLSTDWKLIFIGSKENRYLEELKSIYSEYTKNSKMKKEVQFLTNVERENIYDYVKRAQIYMMTSKWEAFPISIIEAMASGIPFISTDVGIVKFLDGGIIAKSEEELIFCLEKFAFDEELREQYGRIGQYSARKNNKKDMKIQELSNIILNIKGEKN